MAEFEGERRVLPDKLPELEWLPSLTMFEGEGYFLNLGDDDWRNRGFWLVGVPTGDELVSLQERLEREISVLNDGRRVLVVLGSKRKAMPLMGELAKLDMECNLKVRLHFHPNGVGWKPSAGDIIHAKRYPHREGDYVWTDIGVYRYVVPSDLLAGVTWPELIEDFFTRKALETVVRRTSGSLVSRVPEKLVDIVNAYLHADIGDLGVKRYVQRLKWVRLWERLVDAVCGDDYVDGWDRLWLDFWREHGAEIELYPINNRRGIKRVVEHVFEVDGVR